MEQLIPQLFSRMTEEEYLQMEETAETKHEFWNGTIIDMAGATLDHIRIASNLNRHFANKLDGKPCQPFGSDLRVQITNTRNYYYPDMTIVCGPVELAWPDRPTTIVNPHVVLEIESPSSKARDIGEKFDDYREIDSLKEYFLVSQDRYRVQCFYRQTDGVWAFGPSYTQPSQYVIFRSLKIEISLQEIYAGVTIPSSDGQKAN